MDAMDKYLSDSTFFMILSITATIESIMFLFSCFMLCKKEKELDDNGKDLIFKKYSKRMIITGIICFAVFFLVAINSQEFYRYGSHSTGHLGNFKWETDYSTVIFNDDRFLFYMLCVGAPMLLLGALFPFYMYPTKVARAKGHDQTAVITWINAIFGVTLIFWIAMLMWANSAGNPKKTSGDASLTDKLSELQTLKDSGIITQEEYDAKRKELIDKM